MGKILIIKDADFSANGIQIGNTVDIASGITLTRGHNISGSTTNKKRMGTASHIDLSSYISQGYTTLTAIVINTSMNNQCLKMDNSDGTQSFQPESGYVAENITVTLNPSMPYLTYSMARMDGNDYATSYSASQVAKLILSNY